MIKHTPGPWMDDQADHDAPYQDIRIKGGSPRRTVCIVWIDDAPVHDFNAEQDANARLIAAAPDMLQALQAVLAFIEGEPDAVEPFDMVRAAYAKAGGNHD
jgi:hypothetical protein